MLALNYKKIGIESLHNLLETNELSDCKNINQNQLGKIIETFEARLQSSIKSTTDTDENFVEPKKYKNTDGTEAENIDYQSHLKQTMTI